MELLTATKALSALSQPTRLETFRLLVRSGQVGMPAGDIARTLGIPHNTMSSHLAILGNAGLVVSRRDGRSIIYSIAFDGVRDLLTYLVEDCCRGHPELCRPVLDSVLADCCGKAQKRRRQ